MALSLTSATAQVPAEPLPVRVWHHACSLTAGDSLAIPLAPAPFGATEHTVEVCARHTAARPFTLAGMGAEVTATTVTTSRGNEYERCALRLTARTALAAVDTLITDGVQRDVPLTVAITRRSDCTVAIGVAQGFPEHIATLPAAPATADSAWTLAAPSGRGELLVSHIVTEAIPDVRARWRALGTAAATADSLARVTRQPGSPAGLWTLYDRTADPDAARIGGRYTLAVIPAGSPGAFDIIYLGGAEACAPLWEPGMLKGRLSPTAYLGRYSLMWVDSTLSPVTADSSAILGTDGAILELHFPLLEASLRLARAD